MHLFVRFAARVWPASTFLFHYRAAGYADESRSKGSASHAKSRPTGGQGTGQFADSYSIVSLYSFNMISAYCSSSPLVHQAIKNVGSFTSVARVHWHAGNQPWRSFTQSGPFAIHLPPFAAPELAFHWQVHLARASSYPQDTGDYQRCLQVQRHCTTRRPCRKIRSRTPKPDKLQGANEEQLTSNNPV